MMCRICLQDVDGQAIAVQAPVDPDNLPGEGPIQLPCGHNHTVHRHCLDSYLRHPQYLREQTQPCPECYHRFDVTNITPTQFWPIFPKDPISRMVAGMLVFGTFAIGMHVMHQVADYFTGREPRFWTVHALREWIASRPDPKLALTNALKHSCIKIAICPLMLSSGAAALSLWNAEPQRREEAHKHLLKTVFVSTLLSFAIPILFRHYVGKAIARSKGLPPNIVHYNYFLPKEYAKFAGQLGWTVYLDFTAFELLCLGAFASHRLFRRPPPQKHEGIDFDVRLLISLLVATPSLVLLNDSVRGWHRAIRGSITMTAFAATLIFVGYWVSPRWKEEWSHR